jgi:hypothetical protein
MMHSIHEFMNVFEKVLARPQMFKIERVEDIEIIFITEVHINSNIIFSEWLNQFNQFVVQEVDSDLKKFNWCNIIRLYSGSNKHSIELFLELYFKFKEKWSKST